MTRITLALALLLVLPAMPVSATHIQPGTLPTPEAPDLPEETLAPTGIIPVDREQREALVGANETAAAGGNVVVKVVDRANQVRLGGLGAVRLFDDRFDPVRHGGFGEWQVLGKHAWARLPGVGSDGFGYTVASNADGTYPGFASSTLVSPELDLRTGLDRPNATHHALPFLAAVRALAMGVPREDPGLDERGAGAAGIYGGLAQGARENNVSWPADDPVLDAFGQVVPLLAQAEGAVATPLPEVAVDPTPTNAGASRLLMTLQQGLSYGASRDCYVGVSGCAVNNPGIDPIDAAGRDGLTTLQFQVRHNLGLGRDTVRLAVLTEPPTATALASCQAYLDPNQAPASEAEVAADPTNVQNATTRDQPCVLVAPLERTETPSAFAEWDGYTGAQSWRTQSLDLSPWVGRSVWVAWLFESKATSPQYFQNPEYFSAGAGFFGFAFDNVTLTTPGAPQSMRMRPLREPSLHPGNPPTDRPTLAVGSALATPADIINMGLDTATAYVDLELVHRANGTVAGHHRFGPVELVPGEAWRASTTWPGSTADPAHFTVQASVSSGRFEADPSDDAARLDVDIRNVTGWAVGPLERAKPSIRLGEEAIFTMEVQNPGNVPVVLRATAQLLRVSGPDQATPVSNAEFTADPHKGPFTVAAGDRTILEWRVRGTETGTYQLFARVDEAKAFKPQSVFQPLRDLVPEDLQPRRAGWTATPPVVDGAFGPQEWEGALVLPIELRDSLGQKAVAAAPGPGSDGEMSQGTLRILNDAQDLYLGYEWTVSPDALVKGASVLLDDGANGTLAGDEAGVTVRGCFVGGATAAAGLTCAGTVLGPLNYSGSPRAGRGDFLVHDPALGRSLANVTNATTGLGVPLLDIEDHVQFLYYENTTFTAPNPRLHRDATWLIDLDGSGTASEGDYRLPGNKTRIGHLAAGDWRPTGVATVRIRTLCGSGPFFLGEPVRLFNSATTMADCEKPVGTLRLGNGTSEINNTARPAEPLRQPLPPTFRFRDNDGDGRFGPGDGLYIDVQGSAYSLSTAASPPAALVITNGGPSIRDRVVLEMAMPLNDTKSLAALPGGLVRTLLVSELRGSTARNHYLRSPPGGAFQDGHGMAVADGDLSDEARSWLSIRLAAGPATTAADGEQRRRSLGFGVERAPPALAAVDLSSCSDLDGWWQSAIIPLATAATPYAWDGGRSVEKWTCGPYGPDGRVRLYEGRVPQGDCHGDPCLGGAGSGSDKSARDPSLLVSPPIEVPSGMEPYLVLRHQYATAMTINDQDSFIDQLRPHSIDLQGGAQVFVQERLPDKTWGPFTLVVPQAGYSEPARSGLAGEPRDVYLPRSWKATEAQPALCAVDDVTLPTAGGGTNSWFVPARNCAWYWPTGEHPNLRPAGMPVPVGGTMSGSPWIVDRLPLFGPGHGFLGDQTLDLSGGAFRLVFSFQDMSPLQGNGDVGWRIDGFAITETPAFTTDVQMAAVGFPPNLPALAAHGVPPLQEIPLTASVANTGLQDVSGIRIRVQALRATDGAAVCEGVLDGFSLASASEANVTVTCVPTGVAAQHIVLAAEAALASGLDDFPSDNRVVTGTPIPVKARPDVAILADVDPRDATRDEPRTLFLAVENRGNVPLSNIRVNATVLRDDANGGSPVMSRSWLLQGTLAVGARLNITDAQAMATPVVLPRDRSFTMKGLASVYHLRATAFVGQDDDRSNDAERLVFRGFDSQYANDFDATSPLDGMALAGAWQVAPNSGDGTRRLLAGNLTTGDLPLDSDALLTLPPQDLRSLKGATLSFLHRFDLEEGYDGARVEISTDGGSSWRALTPRAQPLSGLPLGHSTSPLLGSSQLAADRGGPGAAFTGMSSRLPTDADGWVTASYDLVQDPGLSRRAGVEAFSIQGMPNHPLPTPMRLGESDAFTHPAWATAGATRATQGELWWIENLTYSEPRPHSGETMWWSGSAGPDRSDRPLGAVNGTLSYRFTDLAPARPGDQVLLTWWDWRAGSADGGTGGVFDVLVGGATRDVLLLETGDGGWTQRGVDVTGASSGVVSFVYRSDARTSAPPAKTSNNRGWHIDDIQAYSFAFDRRGGGLVDPLPTGGLDNLESLARGAFSADQGGQSGRWTTTVGDTATANRPTGWTPVGARASAAPGGWHISEQAVPGLGRVPTWRFGDTGEQGYPHGSDARLVTPLVDLSETASGNLELRWEQRHWLESLRRCPLDETPAGTAEARRLQGCFEDALDMGIVEFQVLDPATGKFGPWRQLGADLDRFPERLFFHAEDDDCSLPHGKTNGDTDPPGAPCTVLSRFPDRLAVHAASREALASTGYNGLEPRMDVGNLRCGAPTQPFFTPGGQGTAFPASKAFTNYAFEYGKPCDATQVTESTVPWRAGNVSYVFTGDSGGWTTVSWDVSELAGRQVRFAFHASTDPGFVPSEDAPPREERGWSIANLQVVGDVFQGRPALLRLRVGTDGSFAKGEWSIDNLTLVGERFSLNPAVLPLGPTVLEGAPHATLDVPFEAANLGGALQTGLAIGFVAAVGDAPLHGATATFARPATPIPAQELPAGIAQGWRLGDLGAGEVVPATLRLTLPEDGTTVRSRLVVLKDNPVQGADGVRHNYRPALGDLPANLALDLRVDVRTRTDIVAETLAGGEPLAFEGDFSQAGRPIAFEARLRNNGTTQPLVQDRWTVWEVRTRGGQGDAQPGVGPEDLGHVHAQAGTLAPMARGSARSASMTFIPEAPGLYRVQLDVLAGGQAVTQLRREVLVGQQGVYHVTEFAHGAGGWTEASPTYVPEQQGSPEALRFRPMEGSFGWGVTETEFSDGATYCTPSTGADCHTEAATSTAGGGVPPVGTVRGMEALALGPLIDLRRVPQGRAALTLEHGHAFEPGDGARIEMMPVRLVGGAAQPLFQCADLAPMTFIPAASSDDGYQGVVGSRLGYPYEGFTAGQVSRPGQSVPDRIHPLATVPGRPLPAIGGPAQDDVYTSFLLDGPLAATCPDARGLWTALDVVNYLVVPVLRVGTQLGVTGIDLPGGDDLRVGSKGWQVRSVRIASTGVALAPETQSFPVRDGLAKQFAVIVRNTGESSDRFALNVTAEPDSGPIEWVQFPAPVVDLKPGASASVPFTVFIPADRGLARGAYGFRVTATSVHDPGVRSTSRLVLDLGANLLPDLAASARLDSLSTPAHVEVGSSQPVHITVVNNGHLATPELPIVLRAVGPDGSAVEIDAATVKGLCPRPTCGETGSRAVLDLHWTVPAAEGQHVLEVVVDPAGRLLEEERANNVARLLATAVPKQYPDVAVTSLDVSGIGPAGRVKEGELLQMRATVRNLGIEVAQDVAVGVFYNAFPLNETTIPLLAPGASFVIEATTTAVRGDVTIKAQAISSNLDPVRDNNGQTVLIRVAGQAIGVWPDRADLALQAGGNATLALNVSNDGDAIEVVALEAFVPQGWAWAIEPNPLMIAAGGNASANLTLLAPANATAGDHAVRLEAASASGPGSAVGTALVASVAPALGQPTVAVPPTRLAPGPALLPANLSGSGNRPQDVVVSLLSPGWGTGNVLARMEPGRITPVAIPIEVPVATPPGLQAVRILVADGAGQSVTTAVAQVEVLARPHAAAAWVSVRATEAPLGLQATTFALGLTNTGNVPINLSVEVSELDAGSRLEAAVADVHLEVGATRNVTWRVLHDGVARPSGSVAVSIADAGGPALARLRLPPVGAAPDLVVSSAQALGEVRAGRALRMQVVVENAGLLPAPATTLYASLDGALVEALDVPPLASRQRAVLNVTWTIDAPGRHLVSFLADGEGVLAEANDDGNGRSIEVQVGKPPALDRVRDVPAPSVPALTGLLALLVALTLRRRRP